MMSRWIAYLLVCAVAGLGCGEPAPDPIEPDAGGQGDVSTDGEVGEADAADATEEPVESFDEYAKGDVRLLGGSDNDFGYEIDVGPDGSIYISGVTEGGLGRERHGGRWDGYVAKFEPGETEPAWVRLVPPSSVNAVTGAAVDEAGNVYAAGLTAEAFWGASYGGGDSDAYIVSFGPDGERRWLEFVGTESWDIFSTVTLVNGNVVGVGATAGSPRSTQQSGGGDALVATYGTDGAHQKTELVGRSGRQLGQDLTTGPDGDRYLAGSTAAGFDGREFNGGRFDAFVAKLDEEATTKWTRLVGTSSRDRGLSIAVAETGEVALVGSTGASIGDTEYGGGESDGFIVELSETGERKAARQIATSGGDVVRGVAYHGDALVVGGGVGGAVGETEYAGGIGDAFVASYEPGADRLNPRLYGTSKSDIANDLAVGDDGAIHLVGQTGGDFGGESGGGAQDTFVMTLE